MSHPSPGTARPRRSVLYMPGANERALEKARTLPADALILDLEDAVAPAAKEEARERVCDLVARNRDRSLYGAREVTIRVNAAGTPWHDDDLAAAGAAGPDAVVVPKVESVAAVAAIDEALARAGTASPVALWAMIETPRGVLDADRIATASDRLNALVMGTNDLAAELHAEPGADRGPLLDALSRCVLAARAAGISALDGVFNAVRDADGFAAEARQGRRYGFDGKTLIHPSQVEPANAIFAPSEEQIEHARRVIDAFTEAENAGRGVATLDGSMIENLHVATARRVLALAEAVGDHMPGDLDGGPRGRATVTE